MFMSLDIQTLKAKFVAGKEYDLDQILALAYRDLQLRTITGHNSAIKEKCVAYLKKQFETIIKDQPLSDENFETKHKEICDDFMDNINSFSAIEEQSYGKAQKVVNIIFKFLVAHGIWKNENQCHMPVDSFVLHWVYGKDTYNGTAWSNLSYEQYVQVQKEILEKIKNPITVGSKSGIKVNNRAEADYYVWYITKVERNYKDVKNAIKKLADNIDKDDAECVNKADADKIVAELEKLKEKIRQTWN